jgi:hypothetical protein
MTDDSPHEKALELKLEDLQRENQRLRNARGTITSQLGPLPISAAIVAGLVSGFSSTGSAHLNHDLVTAALWVFGVMVLVSALFSGLAPYRKLRDRAETKKNLRPSQTDDPVKWREQMIEIEETVQGKTPSRLVATLLMLIPVPRPAITLKDACDQEWKGLFLTKGLFVAVIVLLILARLD